MSLSEDRNAQLIRENRRLLRAMREREMLLIESLSLLRCRKANVGSREYVAGMISSKLKQWGLIGK